MILLIKIICFRWGYFVMFNLSYEFKNNIPLFKCTYCGKCYSCIESKNFFYINRGCCWYFPKYTLVDIKNILNLGKKDFILNLFNMPNAYILQYSIIIQGIFDYDKYEEYKNKNYCLDACEDNTINSFNTKLFFKLCPFFKNNGCSLDYSLRPHPCNLYLCRDVIDLCYDYYKNYSRERKDYFAYCNYFNESIKYLLIDNRVNFLTNLNKSLNLIENFDMPSFKPCTLRRIYFSPSLPHNSGTNNRAV